MAKYSNTVEYQIRTTLDSSGIAQLKAELNGLQNALVSKRANGLIPKETFNQTMKDIKRVETALTTAFNGKLGMLDLRKFNSELMAGGKTLNGYYQSFSRLGAQGTRAFGQMYGQMTQINTGMKQISSTTDKIMNTFGNTFRWGMIASVFSGMMNSIHKSVQYVKDLDKSLTNIQMVTASSRDSMNNFAVQANEAAKRLGGTTVQMTNATEVFIRQGHSLQTSTQLGEYAVHLANVSGQDSALASDEITAYMNAFKIPLEDLGNAVSKWAAVANNAAVSVEELSVASQKAAAVATTVGVDMDQFAAHIAAIEATTREAPENIGNGLKTIYSRIADVKLGETLEDGVDLGSFSKAIEKVGVEVLDQAGNLRDAGDILQDLMGVWQDLDQSQRAALAKTVAGRFQLARFEALMNSADIYENALKVSQAETGTDTYDRMQETYRDSMEGRLNALSATVEGIFTKAFNTDDFYGLIDAATALAETFDNLIQAIGGGNAALTALGAILTKVFANNIAQGIGNTVMNRQTNQMVSSNMDTLMTNARLTAAQGGAGIGSSYMNSMTNNVANVQRYMGSASKEQLEMLDATVQKHITIMTEASIAEEKFTSTLEATEVLLRSHQDYIEGNGTAMERYSAIIQKLANAEADQEAYTAAQNEFYKALETDVTMLTNRLVGLADAFTRAGKTGQLNGEVLAQLKAESGSLSLIVRELAESELVSAERKQQLLRVSEALIAIQQGEITTTEKLEAILSRAGLDAEKFATALREVGADGVNVRQVLEQLVLQYNQLSSAAAVSTKEMEGLSGALLAQNFAKNIATVASGTMNVVFAIQSIHSALDALSNENLDPFEQLEQGLMGFSIAIAMTAPMVASLIKTIREQLKVTRIATLQTEIDTISKKQNMIADMELAISTSLLTKATAAKTDAEIKDVFVTMMQEKGTKKLTRSEIALIAAITGKKAAEIEAIAVEAGAIIVTRTFAQAVRDLAKAFFSVIGAVAPYLAIAAAIGGTIALVAIQIKKAHDEYYRFDIALEKAKDNLTAANEQLDIAKDRVEALNTGLEKIKDIDNTFEGLSKGTTEWNQALLEANENVLDLITQYPELAKMVEHGKFGELTLGEDAQKFIEEKTQSQLEGAQIRAALAQNDVFEAERNKYMMDYIHQNAIFISGKGENVSYIGGGYGSPGFQVLNDEGILNDAQSIVNMWDKAEGDINHFTRLLDDAGYSKEQIAALTENTKNLQNLSNSLAENTLAQQASNEARAAQLMTDNEMYQNLSAEGQKAVDAQVATAFNENSKQYQEAQTKFTEEFNDNTEQIIQWAEDNGIFGTGSKRDSDGKWYDAEGQEIARINNLDEEELVEEIHSAYIGQAIADNIQQHADEIVRPIRDALEHIEDNFGDKGEDIAKIFAGNGKLNPSVINDINWEEVDMTKLNLADLQALGFNSYQEFAEAFENASAAAPLTPHIDTTSKYDFDTDAEVDNYLENYTNIDRDTLDTATNMRIEEYGETGNRDFMANQDAIVEAEKDLAEAVKRYGVESKEAANSLERLNKIRKDDAEDVKSYEKSLQRATAAEARMTKTIEEMSDNFEENAAILQTAEKGSIAYAEALNTTRDQLGGLLDVDPESFSDDFVASAETLDLMKQSAEGVEGAYDELRLAASKNIIQNLEINEVDAYGNPTDVNAIHSALNDMVTDLNSQHLGINMEANLQDANWYKQINQMLMSGQITADQLTQILSSAGFVGQIKTFKAPGFVPQTTYEVEVGPLTNVGTDENPIQFPSSFTMTPHTTKKLAMVDYPVLAGATQKGGVTQAVQNLGGGGSGGGGGKKGGGGRKGKTYEPKKKDYSKKEKDRYEKVNTALDKIDSSIQNLTMDQDRLIGTRWADNLDKETKLLKEQIPWYKEKLKIQKAEAKELRDQLSKDYGAAFGKNGQLQNYAKIFDQLEKARAEAYKRYNAEKTEAGQKAAEEAIKKIEERQATFEKLYQRYDTLWSKDIPATDKALKEIQDRLEDIAEEARKARREAAKSLDEIREAEREIDKTFGNLTGEHPEWNLTVDFGRLDDLTNSSAFQDQLADWISNYEQKLASATDKNLKKWYQDQIKLLKDAQNNGTSVLDLNRQRLAELMKAYEQWENTGKSDLFGENEQAMFDAINEALDDEKDLVSNIDGAIKDVKSDIEDMADMLDNEIEKRQNELDAIGDKIEHIQNISELIYGDQATAQQINLYNMQAQNEENRLKELEKEREIQHAITEQKRLLYELDKDNKTAQKEYLDALDKERDIDNDILDTREKIAEAYKDAKEAANDLAVDNWLNNFNGMIDGVNVPLEYMADQWERIQENEELYLDDLNKAYEIQKLQNKYQQMINDATDPAIQQQITDQMNEQLAYLREKTNLSKYDVDYANAQLEILQKTIALEDAREAKNTMKLRRDSQGNYQYVYAADKKQTADAENDLLDATMNAYNMSKEQQADVQDNYIKKIQDMGDALRKAANDQKLTKEQIAVITQDIIDQGYEYLNAMGEQLDTSQKNMIQSFIDAAFQMQVENASAVQDIAQDLQDGITDTLDMVDDRFDTSIKFWIGDDGLGKFQDEADETRDIIISNIGDFEAAVSDANVAVARPLNEMEDQVNDVNTSIEDMTESMGEFFDLLEQKSGAITAASDRVADLQSQLVDSKNELSQYIQQMNKLNDKNKAQQATITQLKATINNLQNGGSSGPGGSTGGGTKGKDPTSRRAGDRTGFTGWYHEDSTGAGKAGKLYAGQAGAVKISSFSKVPYGNNSASPYGAYYVHIETPGGSHLGWIKPEQMFDTGGYTGTWGKGGRMAMLHEKELVLNADDTRNVLAAVDAVRQITEQLKGAAIGNGLVASIGRAVQNTIQGSNVEQRVEISANFPNVNSAQEIENALLGLSDTSYQYAYNKNDIPW